MCFLSSGCSGPQSVLDPAGPFALPVSGLWWAMFAYALLVWLAIVLLWIVALRRQPKALSEAQSRRTSLRWIVGGGVVFPMLSTSLLLTFGIPIGHRLLPLPTESAPLRIDITGRQWQWEVRYPDAGVVVSGELHLPRGVPVDIHATSADVIHSFWVPRLGGKIDAIPGRTNVRRLQADRLGRFRGQCSEFCGRGHAHMVLGVTVHEPQAFAQWLAARQRSPAPGQGEAMSDEPGAGRVRQGVKP